MDFETRKKYYNLCDPYEPLEPGDERNLSLDEFGDAPVRGGNWVRRLSSHIELTSRPVFELFTGLPGSGKSTELRRLRDRLADPKGAHLLPVYIDARDEMDLSGEIDIPDLLAIIVFRTEEAVLTAEGKNTEAALREGYFARFWYWLTTTDVELTRAELAITSGPKLIAELKTRESFRSGLRKAVAAQFAHFLDDIRQEMRLLDIRAKAAGHGGVVVIFDSLEQLRGLTSTWQQVLDSAERAFGSGAPYLRLPVHTIFTIPTALVTRRFFEAAEFMPMIKLATREGVPYPLGLEAARALIRKRMPDSVLADLFGETWEDRVAELLRWSGGYPREIVRLLRAAISISKSPVPDRDFRRLLGEVRDQYQLLVPGNAYEWLARVAVEKKLVIQDEEHRFAADLMLQNHAVLRYVNDEAWFELHPAVRVIPGVAAAIERRLRGERNGGDQESGYASSSTEGS